MRVISLKWNSSVLRKEWISSYWRGIVDSFGLLWLTVISPVCFRDDHVTFTIQAPVFSYDDKDFCEGDCYSYYRLCGGYNHTFFCELNANVFTWRNPYYRISFSFQIISMPRMCSI